MEAISYEEMYKAYEDCCVKKKNKDSTKKFTMNALFNVVNLVDEINSRHYEIKPSKCFIVKYPTTREVFCANFRDRVVQHFIFNEINPIMDKIFIYDAANCRVGKGTDFAIKRVKTFVRRETDNYTTEAYYLKFDLSGFFMNIDRKLLLDKIFSFMEEKYNGEHKETLKYLIEKIILNDCTKNAIRCSPIEDWDKLPQNKTLFGNENGLPIGNICSQLFANFYLNDLDHLLKSRHSSVSRYVDDGIIVDKSKERLKETLKIIKEYLPLINMKLNLKKTQINKVSYGIKYLGIKIYPHYTIIGKSRINRTYYSSKNFKNIEKAGQSMASRWGMFKRYHGTKIAKRWYYNLPLKITKRIKIDDRKGFVDIVNRKKKYYKAKNKKLNRLSKS